MKKKKLNLEKKLFLNKESVVILSADQEYKIKGGATDISPSIVTAPYCICCRPTIDALTNCSPCVETAPPKCI